MDDATLDALRTAACAVVDIGYAGVAGALVTRWLLRVPHESRARPSGWAARRAGVARRAMGLAGGVALAGSLAWMWVVAMAMTDLGPWAALGEWRPILDGTQAGGAWKVQAGALAACIAAAAPLAARGWPRVAAGVAALAVLVFAGARASAGHAGAAGFDAWTLAMAAHLLAIGAWAGAVIAGAAVALRDDGEALAQDVDRAAVARYLARLSKLATAALAVVVLTGAASAWHASGGRASVLMPARGMSAWAAVLDAKGVLVAAAVALGAFNRFATLPPLLAALASPRADAGPPLRRFTGVLRVEAVVLTAVLAVAAALANGAPPP
jgi:putative copper resistance protein D